LAWGFRSEPGGLPRGGRIGGDLGSKLVHRMILGIERNAVGLLGGSRHVVRLDEVAAKINSRVLPCCRKAIRL
jgi:hypothetical protein